MKKIFLYIFILGVSLIFGQSVFAIDESFEGLSTGLINGQDSWVSTATTTKITTDTIFGNNTFNQHESISWSAVKNNYTLEANGTECFYMYFKKLDEVNPTAYYTSVGLYDYISSYSFIGEIRIYGDGDIHYMNYGVGDIDSGADIILDSWTQFCMEWKDTDEIRYNVDGSWSSWYNSDTGTRGVNTIYLAGSAGFNVNIDNFNGTYNSSFFDDDKLFFQYPLNGWELSNDEWNDWELIYDMESDDLGDLYNIILVVSQDIFGTIYSDWDIISSTTEQTLWTINRDDDIADGEVYSQAKLVAIDDCDDMEDDDCVWRQIAITDYIVWTASSTGYSKYDIDFPYGSLFNPTSATFTPHTLLAGDETTGNSYIDTILLGVKRMFPFGLIGQFLTFTNQVQSEMNNASTTIMLSDFIPTEYESYMNNDAVILSTHYFDGKFTLWEEKIYPAMENFIRLIFILIWITILLPDVQAVLGITRESGYGKNQIEYKSSAPREKKYKRLI